MWNDGCWDGPGCGVDTCCSSREVTAGYGTDLFGNQYAVAKSNAFDNQAAASALRVGRLRRRRLRCQSRRFKPNLLATNRPQAIAARSYQHTRGLCRCRLFQPDHVGLHRHGIELAAVDQGLDLRLERGSIFIDISLGRNLHGHGLRIALIEDQDAPCLSCLVQASGAHHIRVKFRFERTVHDPNILRYERAICRCHCSDLDPVAFLRSWLGVGTDTDRRPANYPGGTSDLLKRSLDFYGNASSVRRQNRYVRGHEIPLYALRRDGQLGADFWRTCHLRIQVDDHDGVIDHPIRRGNFAKHACELDGRRWRARWTKHVNEICKQIPG